MNRTSANGKGSAAGRLALLVVFVLGCFHKQPPLVVLLPTPANERAPATVDRAELGGRQLMVPVDGVRPEKLTDSFDAPRSGERVHQSIDIMAARRTPVLAADDGRVFKMGANKLGGTTMYVVDANERFIYYYAHLDGYRDGIQEGDQVKQGDVLGYVGTTGNAPPDLPHLHFQMMRYQRDRYWEGAPINPKPLLTRPGRQR